jgi:2,3-bisphosphoglycerate-dependent phosphoglycerate mutase
MKCKIYLFRHGQTVYNKNGIFTGWKDSKLTPAGIGNAKTIAKKLKSKKFEVAVCTSLSRSKDTLAEVIKFHPECTKLVIDDRMKERRYGKLEGKSHDSFVKEAGKKDLNYLKSHGDALENLDPKKRKQLEKILGKTEYDQIHRGFNVRPPGGESFADVEKRVDKFIKSLKKFLKKEKVNIAISAHGNSIRLFRKIMEKASIKNTVKWDIPYDKYFEYTINV